MSKAVPAILFAAVVLLGMFLQHTLNGPTPYLLKVPVQDAAGLYEGSDVMIAGSKVGQVESIELEDGFALVTAGIDPAQAPVHSDATVSVRPKSLLGERYLALDPGRNASVLPSGATLPRTRVSIPTDLQDVINSFDAPTRDRLQTVVNELGGGVSDRGPELNLGLQYGRQDLSDLSAIAQTLASRQQELQAVIQDLAVVTQELAQSDRSQQLGQLIANTQQLMKNLADQDGQLQQAIVQTDAALSRTTGSLDGTQGNLSDIAAQLPTTERLGDLVLTDLTQTSGALLPHLGQLVQGIQAGPEVFGGRDAAGYATRISLVVGSSSAGLPASALGLPNTPTPPVPQPSAGGQPAPSPAAPPNQGLGGVLGFLVGGQQ